MTPTRHVHLALLLMAFCALCSPSPAAARSYDLCDPNDRAAFEQDAKSTWVAGPIVPNAGPGQALVFRANGLNVLDENDLMVHVGAVRPGVEAGEGQTSGSSNSESCVFGDSVNRWLTPRKLSDTELEITLPHDMIWGTVKSVPGLYSITNIDVYYVSACGEFADLGGTAHGYDYQPVAPGALSIYARSVDEAVLSWSYAGDETSIEGFRVYQWECLDRVCILPDAEDYREFYEFTAPPFAPLSPSSRSVPLEYEEVHRGGTFYYVMTSSSEACGESPPSRMVRVELPAPGASVPPNEDPLGEAEVHVSYVDEMDANGFPVLSPFPGPSLETGDRRFPGPAFAFYDADASGVVEVSPSSSEAAFPLHHVPLRKGVMTLEHSSGYDASANARANIIVYAPFWVGGHHYHATVHLYRDPISGSLSVASMLAGNNATGEWNYLMISPNRTGSANVPTLTLPANGQSGHIEGSVTATVVYLEPLETPRQTPYGTQFVQTWENDITLSFDAPLIADN